MNYPTQAQVFVFFVQHLPCKSTVYMVQLSRNILYKNSTYIPSMMRTLQNYCIWALLSKRTHFTNELRSSQVNL